MLSIANTNAGKQEFKQFASATARGLEQELLLAGELQSALLPAIRPIAKVDLAAHCAPARMLGGDFYDFFRFSSKPISAGALGDVSGKGAPAAIYAALVTGLLRSLDDQELGPAEMLRTLNATLMKRPVQARFVSMIYTTWDDRNRELRFANSGLPHPIWIHRGKPIAIETSGLPLGLFADAEYSEQVVHCAAGDIIVFFTDGVTEPVDCNGGGIWTRAARIAGARKYSSRRAANDPNDSRSGQSAYLWSGAV